MRTKVTICSVVAFKVLIWLSERSALSLGEGRAGKLQLEAKGRMFGEGQAGGSTIIDSAQHTGGFKAAHLSIYIFIRCF